jgi:hypothetical protein
MLPSESVHCGVTSPPYWGLRDYSACPCVPQERLGVFGDGRVDRHQPGGALAFHAQERQAWWHRRWDGFSESNRTPRSMLQWHAGGLRPRPRC